MFVSTLLGHPALTFGEDEWLQSSTICRLDSRHRAPSAPPDSKMGLEGDAPWAIGVMWVMAALVFFFLCLRLYTRIVCLASYGVDDHAYIVAFIFLLVFTIFTTIAGHYGFGQTMEEIGSIESAVQATLYECIGQGFAIVGMAIAKSSLGFFLLRLVTVRWHRIAIWCAMTLVMAASIGELRVGCCPFVFVPGLTEPRTAQVLCFWLSCVPIKYVYDRRIPGGYCPIDTRPTSYILCGMFLGPWDLNIDTHWNPIAQYPRSSSTFSLLSSPGLSSCLFICPSVKSLPLQAA